MAESKAPTDPAAEPAAIRRFALAAALYVVTLLPLGVATYEGLTRLRRALDPGQETALYVWGDSRTHEGLDVALLADLSGREVRSWSRHSAGPYSLLAFEDEMPAGADVLLGISLPMFLRAPRRNRLQGGLSVATITRFARLPECTPWLLRRAIKENRNPFSQWWHDTTPASRGFEESEAVLDVFRAHYAAVTPPAHFDSRVEAVRGVIGRLADRGCRVTVVDFPARSDVRELREASIFADYEALVRQFSGGRATPLLDLSPHLPEERAYQDPSHLSAEGRSAFTRALHERLAARDE